VTIAAEQRDAGEVFHLWNFDDGLVVFTTKEGVDDVADVDFERRVLCRDVLKNVNSSDK